jgi:hypothetical protein
MNAGMDFMYEYETLGYEILASDSRRSKVHSDEQTPPSRAQMHNQRSVVTLVMGDLQQIITANKVGLIEES